MVDEFEGLKLGMMNSCRVPKCDIQSAEFMAESVVFDEIKNWSLVCLVPRIILYPHCRSKLGSMPVNELKAETLQSRSWDRLPETLSCLAY